MRSGPPPPPPVRSLGNQRHDTLEQVLERWEAVATERRLSTTEVVQLKVPHEYSTIQAALGAIKRPRLYQILVSSGSFYPFTNDPDSPHREQTPTVLLEHNIEICGVGGEVQLLNAAIRVRGRVKVTLRNIHIVNSPGLHVEHGAELCMFDCCISKALGKAVKARGCNTRLRMENCSVLGSLGLDVCCAAVFECSSCEFDSMHEALTISDHGTRATIRNSTVARGRGECGIKIIRAACSTMRDCEVSRNAHAAVVVGGAETNAVFTSCCFTKQYGTVNSVGISNAAAIKVSDRARAELQDCAVVKNRCLGVFVGGVGTILSAYSQAMLLDYCLSLGITGTTVELNERGLYACMSAVLVMEDNKFANNEEFQVEIAD